MTFPMITAHSGCEDTEIDTLESIDLAMDCGAEAVEIDVRVDKTGELRIAHDAVPQEEYEKKLTLRDVLKYVYDTKLLVNCDLKEQSTLYKTLEEAEKLGFPSKRLILSGCTSPEQLARDPELHKRGLFFLNIEEVVKFIVLYNDPMVQIDQFIQLMSDPWSYIKKHGMDIIEEYINDVVSCYKLLHAAAVNMPKTLLDSIIDRTFQKADIPLSVWTVNEPELVQSCLSEKVFNITTRKVRQAIKLREDYFNGI
ncbi:MAG: glycerophosphodiester phosphodiesterase [Anaerolineaceae bacterium]|nr:glycerophosphodiester phosphodiesterase [Anaerolineaceae bacterium]